MGFVLRAPKRLFQGATSVLVTTAIVATGLTDVASAAESDAERFAYAWPADVEIFDGDGWPVVETTTPQFWVEECDDSEVSADVTYEVRLEGDDGHVVEGVASTPEVVVYPDGSSCGSAEWLPDTELHQDVYYDVLARVVGPDGVGWDWNWGDRLYVAGPPPSPEPVEPADGATIDDGQPVLTVQLNSPLWSRLEVQFQVSSPLGLILQGSVPVSEDGVAAWTVSQVLAAGEYSWSARAARSEGEAVSPWSRESVFTVSAPQQPAPVSPRGGAGVDNPVTLTADVTVGGRASARGVFQVMRADTGDVVAEGASEWTNADGPVSWTVPTGLDRGEYRWRALVSDGASLSDWSPEESFVMAWPPGMPDVWWFSSGIRGGADFQWYAAEDSPDSPVLDYTIRAEPGGYSRTIPADLRSIYHEAITGLPGGRSYTFTVSARNRWGTSTSRARTAWIGWLTPLAPQNVTAHLDGDRATVTWDAPTDTGGEEITGYRVQESPSGAVHELPADQTSFTFTDVVPGTWYSLTVRARTVRGPGDPASAGFLPYTVPGAPTGVAAWLGDGELDVSWTAPESDGWSPITGYRVTVSPGGTELTVGTRTHVTVEGLENGTEYTFSVVALNAAGAGPSSEPSAPRAPVSQWLDADDDGIPDILEERAGSSPDLVDSDFDGLGDFEEVLALTGLTSPTAPDSDGDGIGDADDDADDDGRSNHIELQAGTNPADSDEDGDGLDDGAEHLLGTDPHDGDTDDDGLGDGDEQRLGTDPTLADSDLDGTADADEVVDVDLDGDSVHATISGRAAEALGADVSAGIAMIPGAVTVAASLLPPGDSDPSEEHGTLTAAALVFAVSESQQVDGKQFVAMAWDGQESTWQPAANTVTVSSASHTITVDSPELGVTYAVVDLSEWQARARTCDLAASDNAPLDVEVILDARPGVIEADPTAEGIRAAAEMLSTLSPSDDARLRLVRAIGFYARGNPPPNGIYGEITNGPEVAVGTPSVARVQAQLDEVLVTDWSLDWWWEGYDELDWLDGGFAEQAFGRRDAWPDTRDDACRGEAVVLVTDGRLVPDPEFIDLPDYVPFLERTSPPVHVLDVGTGDIQWLHDVAARTGGTYTHVPTQSPEQTWQRSGIFPPPDPNVFTADDDGDGLGNWLEEFGIWSATVLSDNVRNKFTSDPHDPDTDGDGIPDGDEVGAPLTPAEMGGWTSILPITTYRVRSDPGRRDSDLDGLGDVDEIENELDPLDPDMDRDDLSDGDELLWGTNPFVPHGDGDSYSDGWEAARTDQGFDPTEPNLPIEPESWIQQFTLGAFCGDIEVCRRPSLAWLSGNILSGVAVYGDIRDLAWSFVEGPNLNTAFIAIGLVPAVGDTASAAAKVARILPDLIGTEASSARRLLRELSDDGADFVAHMRTVDGDLVNRLEDAGAAGEGLARLLVSNDPQPLRRLLDSPLHVRATAGPAGAPGFFPDGRAGEQFLRTDLGLDPDAVEKALHVPKTRPLFCRGCRIPDATVTTKVNGRDFVELHESKVGMVHSLFAWRQFQKDVALAQADKAQRIVWHFYASDWTGKIGLTKGLLEKMERLAAESGMDVRLVLHPPVGG